MSGAFPALGFDPAPGDVLVAGDVVQAVQRALHTLVRVRVALDSFGDPGSVWQGEAARAFAGELTELAPYLARAEQSHLRAHNALRTWVDDLVSRQSMARALEEQAEAARRSLVVAGQAADSSAARAVLATDADTEAQTALQAAAWRAEQQLHAAEQELAEVVARARRLIHEHGTQAAETTALLRAAADHAPVEPGVLERLATGLDAALDLPTVLREQAWQFLEDNSSSLAELADVLADATAAAGVVLLVVALSPVALASTPLVAVAAGLGALTLSVRALSDAAGASVPASTYVFDGVSAVTAGVGAAAGIGVRTARVALTVPVTAARAADAGGLAGSATSTALGILQNTDDDRPFMHFVPDSRRELMGAVAGGPAVTAFLSAIDLGREKDRAAAAEEQRARWTR